MEFEERLDALALKVRNQVGAIQTEEATKNAFVMPFISTILGYDVFDPLEVVPESTADVGTKRGEKVDYAIMRASEVQLLIECKQTSDDLRIEHASQLYRYFSVTNARIAVLTNGRAWKFFTDLDQPNRMDDKPFLVLDLLEIDETLLPELRKLTKESFDLDSVISSAEELKYVGSLKREIAAQLGQPSDELVKFFTSKVYDRSYTQKVREQFSALVAKAIRQYLAEQVNGRLKTALGESYTGRVRTEPSNPPATTVPSEPTVTEDLLRDSTIVTTEEEQEAYRIVKAIGCGVVKPHRIAIRDQQSYCSILLDDNNRKPIARLWFNAKKQKYLGVFDVNKVETKHPIVDLDDIYQHADAIRQSVGHYL